MDEVQETDCFVLEDSIDHLQMISYIAAHPHCTP
jgi:hypothetical protein